MKIITRVFGDKCWYTLYYKFDLFSQVDRIYPQEDHYSIWQLMEPASLIADEFEPIGFSEINLGGPIYLGSAYNAADYRWLKDNQIQTIINATHCISNYFPTEFVYHRFATDDTEDGSLAPHYQEFYQALISCSKPVLIHCYAGRSRSAALVLYFLIVYYHMTIPEALNYLKICRPIINLNKQFLDEIEDENENEIENENEH